MRDQLLLEDGLQQVAEERYTGLHMNVELSFGYVEQMMLCGIAEPVDGLEHQRLLVGQELDVPVAKRPADTGVEADRLFCPLLPNASAAVEDGALEQHLERVVELNQRAADTPAVVRAVEQLNAQNERVARLCK